MWKALHVHFMANDEQTKHNQEQNLSILENEKEVKGKSAQPVFRPQWHSDTVYVQDGHLSFPDHVTWKIWIWTIVEERHIVLKCSLRLAQS